MTRARGSASIDLGRRAFGTAGGWKTPGEAPGRSGDVIDLEEGILCAPIHLPVSRPWKPRAGRICNFSIRRVVEEK